MPDGRPVDISASAVPAGYHRSRHYLGPDRPGVVYALLNEAGNEVSSVVIDEGLSREEIRASFDECWTPLPNRLQLPRSGWLPEVVRSAAARIILGKQCVGYAIMEQEAVMRKAEAERD